MIENIILSHVLLDEEYMRKVLPYLKLEYFTEKHEQLVLEYTLKYIEKYNKCPSKQALVIDIDNAQVTNESLFAKVVDYIEGISIDEKQNDEWLINQTETFCKERALHNAIRESILLMDKNSKNKAGVGVIPSLVESALAVSFDNKIGHDYTENIKNRFDFYTTVEERIQFDIDLLNEVTSGGLPKKTFTVFMAGTGGGKSLTMCHMAAANIKAGKNVLYITLEMSEERIAERIDANLMDVNVSSLNSFTWEGFSSRIKKVFSSRTYGKLIIKEYPTSSASVSNFKHLLSELRLKKNFSPDIIYIDYINICASSRVKLGNSGVNSYTFVKTIAEEIRGLAVEFNIPIVSATQVNRTGFTDSDFDLENTSESFGLPATVDFMFGIISTDELVELSQIMFKQLKNRYNDINRKRRFVVGIDKAKMRLYNLEEEAQDDIVEDIPVMSKTTFGPRDDNDNKKISKEKFNGFR